ncbi:ABC-type dipeptide/oligopeptide/nickel transport system, ATPase component [Sulfurospirillum barnesii SES-3]|uniref:ABC-type dipeptide/oligopeptide/nickel transport system, ATPase component n=1 Tax=Sulfurospirillum barnesii (strain ATCC 700032 / DSM 10660 / SES-3) TaxID=760154 RepID=I3XYJ4_SULBS|nr:ABC-type dipeptide/oligopeptide/nickel transport system, ATPase component [Sulfurospirillum barnesii SES-3]
MSFTCKELLIKSKEKVLLNVSFSFERSFAFIGESGSGKSLTLKALLGMLPRELSVSLDYHASYTLQRGESIAFVPQNPFTALSPLSKIERQFMASRKAACGYLEMVGLEEHFLDRFPSELSGGQLQRIIIAMALSLSPRLLLLDEPTTALDEESKTVVLALIKQLQERCGFDLLFVTHDVATIENLCEEIGIIQQGRMVEYGMTHEVLNDPKASYTQQLLSSGFRQRSFRT